MRRQPRARTTAERLRRRRIPSGCMLFYSSTLVVCQDQEWKVDAFLCRFLHPVGVASMSILSLVFSNGSVWNYLGLSTSVFPLKV